MTQTLEVREGRAAKWKAAARVEEIVGEGFDVKKFAENFEVLAEAAGGVSRLRGFVLDLACRGRLVPQIASEGDASALIDAVSSEARLAGGSEVDELFSVPPRWRWATVGQIASYVQRGKSPKYVERSAVPVVSQKCVQWEGFLIERARFIDPLSLETYGDERFLRDGDVLWNSTGHGTVGRVAVFKSDPQFKVVVADSHVTVVRPLIDPRFLWCWLASPSVQATIEDLVSGTTKQTELATSTVLAHPLPLPPLAEQKRIVAKVDQLMALCDELEKSQTKKREVGTRLTKSALEALTTAEGAEEFEVAWKRVVENFDVVVDRAEKVGELRAAILGLAVSGRLVPRSQESWPIVAMSELIESSFYGPRFGKEQYADMGVPTIRTTDMDFRGRVSVEGAPRVKLSPTELEKYALLDGDIILTRTGATIGKCAMYRAVLGPAIPSAYLIRFRFRSDRLLPEYALLYLRSPRGQELLGIGQTAMAQPNINARAVAGFEIPLPSVREQRDIIDAVDHYTQMCDKFEAHLVRAEDCAAKLLEAAVQELVT